MARAAAGGFAARTRRALTAAITGAGVGAVGLTAGGFDARTRRALIAAIAGVGVGLVGLIAGGLVLAFSGGDITRDYVLESPFLNGFAIGIAALALGPVGYFVGRSAKAPPAALIGIGATIIGSASTLLWLVITLLGYYGAPPAQ